MSHSTIARVFRGSIIHSRIVPEVDILPDALIGVNKQGKIAFFEANVGDQLVSLCQKYAIETSMIEDLGSRILIPGFVDTHTHAPQYHFGGTGMDLPLLQWLEKYTFPCESKMSDSEHARTIYRKALRRNAINGSTTTCYFATIYLESSKVLIDELKASGARALVGKVNMDRNAPDFYVEKDVASSIAETEAFVQYVQSAGGPLLHAVITPRFVPTCSSELMKGLGALASKYDLRIQSHISENRDEVSWVASLHPEQNNYGHVYEAHDLLNKKTIMAHGCYMTEDEMKMFEKYSVGLAHCPNSNFSLCSGILDVRQFINRKMKVGLGTDVAGGYAPSMLDAIRRAVDASKVLYTLKGEHPTPLSFLEAFSLATLGGAQVTCLDEEIGSFEVGKAFDALLVDPLVTGSPIDIFKEDSLEDTFLKFLSNGDDRNLASIFVNGQDILPALQ